LPEGVNLDDRELVRIQAMIQSMTPGEKADPYVLIREPSRVKRISKGSGQPEVGVQELVQKFLFMRQMMSGMKQNMGLMGKIPGLKHIASARQMRKAMASGAMPPGLDGLMGGMGGMGGMGLDGLMGGMGGMGGMPGMPGFGMPQPQYDSPTKMKPMSKSEKNQKKAQRRREREARKKSRQK
jgi:signal recognition particle subunit SRP54